MDSNHRSIKQQIYSLSPLATRESSLIQLSALDFRVLDYYSKGIWKMQAFFWIFFDFFWKILKWMWLRTFLKNPRLLRCGKCAFFSQFFKCYWRIVNQSGDLQFIIPSAIIKKLYGECCTMNLVILAAVYDCQGYYLGAGEKLYEGYITASSLKNRLLPKRQNKIDSVCLCSSAG